MAEMESSRRGAKAGSRGKKLSTRIDLMPMVDLGFLLIAFFMVTTTLAKPNVMAVNMPYIGETVTDPPKVKSRTALTVLPGRDHRIYYYEGIGDNPEDPPQLKVAYLKGSESIRNIIMKKKAQVAVWKKSGVLGPKDQLTILIKPDTTSTYADLVGVLDEMNINNVATYAIVDITALEQEWIRAKEVR